MGETDGKTDGRERQRERQMERQRERQMEIRVKTGKTVIFPEIAGRIVPNFLFEG